MPFVSVHMWAGRTTEQKRKLVDAITSALVEHAGANRQNVNVALQEYELSQWGQAGILAIDRPMPKEPEHEERTVPGK